MKHWLETRQVLAQLERWRCRGVAAALATVVDVRGSAYRHEGAKLAVAADGSRAGNVSGGCLELDVCEAARDVLATRRPQLRRYCSRLDEIRAWDLGVGCEGEVAVYIEPVLAARPFELRLLDGDQPFAACTLIVDGPVADDVVPTHWTVPAGDGDPVPAGFAAAVREVVASGRSALRETEAGTIFVDVLRPPPILAIAGAGDDARPLARLAVELGFRVVSIDRRPGLLTAERFPGTALLQSDGDDLAEHLTRPAETFAVVMTHQFADDARYLAALSRLAVPYIGVLGPRQRTERLLADLGEWADAVRERLHAPVGLDIGTEGAEEVALSILAEIMAVRSGRGSLPLRERLQPIHAGAF